jgi:hypothetical protein
VSDDAKEKIKGEVKEVVNTFIKGCEEANFNLIIETIDSTDFIGLTNGITYGYKDFIAMEPVFNTLLNQKCTIVNEKYTFLDKSTVLYTADSRWAVNYKDGHSTLEDPEAFMLILKKINSKWRVTYLVDSYVEKIVKYSEPSKELNQVKLMKQFLGTWKGEMGKDTAFVMEIKSFYNGFESYLKTETKGKIIIEERTIMGYDKKNDKLIESGLMNSNPDIITWVNWFSSSNKMEAVLLEDISNPEKANLKWTFELTSPEVMIWSNIVNNKITGTYTFHRGK